jgi:hypothetical protein
LKLAQAIKMTHTQGGVILPAKIAIPITEFGNSSRHWDIEMPMKRKPITPRDLQLAIAKAVRETDVECEALIGVFVERIVPMLRGDVNWALKGVQYGKADRVKCDAAISVVVERMQHEYIVVDESK